MVALLLFHVHTASDTELLKKLKKICRPYTQAMLAVGLKPFSMAASVDSRHVRRGGVETLGRSVSVVPWSPSHPGHLTAGNELYVGQLSKHSSLNDSSQCLLLSELLFLHSGLFFDITVTTNKAYQY